MQVERMNERCTDLQKVVTQESGSQILSSLDQVPSVVLWVFFIQDSFSCCDAIFSSPLQQRSSLNLIQLWFVFHWFLFQSKRSWWCSWAAEIFASLQHSSIEFVQKHLWVLVSREMLINRLVLDTIHRLKWMFIVSLCTILLIFWRILINGIERILFLHDCLHKQYWCRKTMVDVVLKAFYKLRL